ncbi:MAG: RiPP maturation radical SAM protein 1 [Leptolyngbya sp. PLA1]|nr:RiPP maturation radical SAM protein 1 [Leptolyngbya sp. PLA1]
MRTDRPVVLVMAPWASTSRPGLGVSLMKAIAARVGFPASLLYLNMDFAESLGTELYEHFATQPGLFGLSEHLFAATLHGPAAVKSDAMIERWCRGDEAQALTLRSLRDGPVRAFVARAAETVLARGPGVVGFSCTFNQTMASLAIAAEIKTRAPDVPVVLGGGCVHGAMGLEVSRVAAGFVDAVFTGEADEAFPAFLEARRLGEPAHGVPGVASRGVQRASAPLVHDLDSLPVPDYSDYFARRGSWRTAGGPAPFEGLPFESARGCWWGQKSHCTFCGLNNEGMAFRRKSPGRVLHEVRTLTREHRQTRLLAADNILDHRAYEDLLPGLAAEPTHLRLFYEIKANLKRAQVAALASAGIRWVQPGVESLSSHVLRLMGKGISAMRIVQALRLFAEFGITPSYNILCGFPGETEEDYRGMTDLARRLRHLPPPSGTSSVVQVHRFSPYFASPDRFGLRNVRPAWFYSHLFPEGWVDTSRLAYFFERDEEISPGLVDARARLDEALREWIDAPARRVARLGPGFVEVSADSEPPRTLTLTESVLLVRLDEVTTPEALESEFAGLPGVEPAEVSASLGSMVREGLLATDGKEIVSAVPFEHPTSPETLRAWLELWVSGGGAPGPAADAGGPARRVRLPVLG